MSIGEEGVDSLLMTDGPPEPIIGDPPNPPDVSPLNVTIEGFSYADRNRTAIPPLPDFIIQEMRSSHENPQQSTYVNISVTVQNVGVAPAVSTKVSLYSGLIDQENLIGNQTVSMIGRNDTAYFLWYASTADNYTLIAFVDPSDDIEELDEENNQDTLDIEVGTGPSWGLPDLTGYAMFLGMPEENIETQIDVNTLNTGYGPAAFVSVDVWERPAGMLIGSFSIVNIAMGESVLTRLNWTPSADGVLYVEVMTDVNHMVSEWVEDNNDQTWGVFVAPQGGCSIWLGDYHVPPGQSWQITYTCMYIVGNVIVDGNLLISGSQVIVISPLPGMYGFEVNSGGRLDSIFSTLSGLYQRYPIFFKALAGSSLYIGIYSKIYWPYTSQPELPDSNGGVEVYTPNVAILDSYIMEGNGHGAYFAGQVSLTNVRNVTFKGNGRSGAVIAGASGVFRDNTFSENDFGLVIKGPSSLTVRDSQMIDNVKTGTKNHGIGLLIRDASPDVEDSTSILANDVGVWVDGSSSPTFTDCELEGNLHWGMYVGSPPESGSVSARVSLSRIDASEEAIFSEDASVTVEWVTIENFSHHGIFAMRSSIHLRHNTLYPWHNGGPSPFPSGIVCSECSEPEIRWNDVISRIPGPNGEFWYGVQLVDSSGDVFVDNNTIKYGVYLMAVANSGGSISDNTLVDGVRDFAHGAGLLVDTDIPLRIHNNTFTNVSQGMYFYRQSSSVQGTIAVDNNTMTYKVYEPNYTFMEHTKLKQNGTFDYKQSETDQGHILVYDGSSPLIENNTLTGHVYGISVESGIVGGIVVPSNPVIRYNRILLSGDIGISDSARGVLQAANAPQVIHNWINRSAGAAIYSLSFGGANYSSNLITESHGITRYCWVINRTDSLHCVGQTVTYSNETKGTIFVSGNSTTTFWGNTVDKGDLTGFLIYDVASPDILGNTILRHPEAVTVSRLSLPHLVGNNISLNTKGIAIYGPRPVHNTFVLNTPNRVRENYVGILIQGAKHNLNETDYTVKLDGIEDVGGNNYSVYVNDSTRPWIHNVVIDNSSLPTGAGVGIYSNFSGPRLDGDTCLFYNDYGIVVMGYSEDSIATIEAIKVRGGRYGIYSGDGSIATNFYMLSSGLHGSSIAAVVANSNHYMEHNTISSLQTGIAVRWQGGDVIDNNISSSQTCVYATNYGMPDMRLNHFWNCTTAVYASGTGNPRMGVSSAIRGYNWIDDPNPHFDQMYGVYAVNIVSALETLVIGNSFNYTNYSVFLSHHASTARVTDNDFRGVTWYNQGCAIQVSYSTGFVDIYHNLLSNVSKGICPTISSNVEIHWNTIFTPGIFSYPRWGIITDGSMIKITNNTLLDLGIYPPFNSYGIWLGNASIYDNKISRYYYGVRTVGWLYSPIIRKNTLVDNSIAIRCYNVNAYVENNSISQGDYGITVEFGGGSYIANNTITGLSRGNRRAIQVEAGNPHIVNNSISGTKWGIYVKGGSPVIRGHNRIENNTAVSGVGGYGLFVANSTSVVAFDVYDGNTFKNNSVAGIYLGRNSRVTIRDNNTVADNGKYGIWIEEDAVTFDRQVWWNDVWGNGVQGLHVDADPGGGNYFHAECNWWDGTSSTPPYNLGPYDPSPQPPSQNLYGTGQQVSDYIYYRSWLIGLANSPSTTCTGT